MEHVIYAFVICFVAGAGWDALRRYIEARVWNEAVLERLRMAEQRLETQSEQLRVVRERMTLQQGTGASRLRA